MLEGMTTLGFMAAHSERARLGLMVGGDPLPLPRPVGQGHDHARRPVRRAGLARHRRGLERDESRALGFPFPPLGERFEMLEDTLRIAHGMWQGERGSEERFEGRHVRAHAAAQLAAVDLAAAGPDHDRRRRRAEDAPARRPVRRRDQRLRRPARGSPTSTRSCASHCEAVGRDFDEIERTTLAVDQPRRRRPPRAATAADQVVDRFGELGDAGAQHIIFSVRGVEDTGRHRAARTRDHPPAACPPGRIVSSGVRYPQGVSFGEYDRADRRPDPGARTKDRPSR